jgi:hypothetical protein
MISTIDRSLIRQTGRLPADINLFQDTYPLKIIDQKTITESKGGRPVFKVTGIFQKCDEENANGRIYTRDILTSAVQDIQEDINKRAIMGEYDHPTDAKIHLDRVSHIITKVWLEGKYVYGEAEILEDMPCGAMLATLLRNKVQIGISSRGVGDMETVNEGQKELFKVLPGYQFVTWDMVAEPSVTEAVMSVMESRNRILTRSRRTEIDPAAELIREINNWLKNEV